MAGASAQVRYRSATRTRPLRARRQLGAQVGAQSTAGDQLIEPAHGDDRGGRRRPVRLDLQVVVAHDERAAPDLERAKRLHVLQAVVPSRHDLEHRLARRPLARDPLREKAVQGLGDVDQGRDAPLALAARRACRPAPRSSPGTPASAAARAACASGQRNQRNATLRAMSAASGERGLQDRAPAGRAARAPRAAGAGSAIHAVSSARTTCTPASYRSRARKIRNTACSSAGVAVQPGDAVMAQRALQARRNSSEAPARSRPGSAGRCGTARAGCGASQRLAAPTRARRCRRTPSPGPARHAAPHVRADRASRSAR